MQKEELNPSIGNRKLENYQAIAIRIGFAGIGLVLIKVFFFFFLALFSSLAAWAGVHLYRIWRMK